MKRPADPLFLERQSYRRRRLGDAARLLPILGAILFLLPVAWTEAAGTGSGLIYLFSVWAGLIAAIFLISRRLAESEPPGPDARGGG